MKKRLVVVLCILFLGCGIYYMFFYVNTVYRNYLSQILGVKNVIVESSQVLGQPLFRDSYYIEIYHFPHDVSEAFLKNPLGNVHFDILDKKIEWKKIGWIKTPCTNQCVEFWNRAVRYGYEDKEIDMILFEIQDILKSNNGYYAIYYESEDLNVNEITEFDIFHILFFILDVRHNILYIIDS